MDRKLEPNPESLPREIWVRQRPEAEIEEYINNLNADEFTKSAFREIRAMFREVLYGPPQSHPPHGKRVGNKVIVEPVLEQIEDRIDVGRGAPRVTRIRRRIVPVLPSDRVKRPRRTTDEAEPPPAEDTGGADGENAARPGPKPLLDEALQERVCIYLEIGLSRSLAAAELGISKSTISRTIRRDPAFKRRVQLAEAAYEKNHTLLLLKAARESWRAAAWLYKNYHPHASGRRRRYEGETRVATDTIERIKDALEPPERKAG